LDLEDRVAGFLRATAIVAACVLFSSVACLAAKHPNLSKGFGEVSWGQDVSRVEGFMKLRSQDGVDYYVNLRERITMKGYGNPTAYYGQVGKRLYAVHLRLKDNQNFDLLKGDLDALYGKGKVSKDQASRVVRWKSGPVRLKLKDDGKSGMKLSFYYQPLASGLAAGLREADPMADDLDSLMPKDSAGVETPPGLTPPKQDPPVGIDLLPYLKEGSKLLKLDRPINNR